MTLETILHSYRKMSDLKVKGVMVYSGISIDKCTDLHIIMNGALTGYRYTDEILRPIALLTLQQLKITSC